MLNSGDIILANIQFVDTSEIKKRPALVLFEESGNVIVAGITSNLKMNGIKLTKKDGAIKDSIIKVDKFTTVYDLDNINEAINDTLTNKIIKAYIKL